MFIIPNLILLRLYHSIFWECNLFTIDNLDNDHESQPINICQVDKKNKISNKNLLQLLIIVWIIVYGKLYVNLFFSC